MTTNQTLDLNALFEAGQEALQKQHQEKEAAKLGILRAGNTGALLPDGTLAGKCAAKTWLRLQGIESEEISEDRHLMFAAGVGNEQLWMDVLNASGYPHKILREEEIPIEWLTRPGIKVTGRPDIVLMGADQKPCLGVELKLVSSVWTARDVLAGKPKTDHLLQAAHYSWQLGIPFQLWYTSRADFAVMGWAVKHFPRKGEPGSESCGYGDKGDVNKVLPFRRGFQVEAHGPENAVVRFTDLSTGRKSETFFSPGDIRAYYEYVASMKQLDKVPVNLESDGAPAGWKLNQYCGLGALCCMNVPQPMDIHEWKSKIQESRKKE